MRKAGGGRGDKRYEISDPVCAQMNDLKEGFLPTFDFIESLGGVSGRQSDKYTNVVEYRPCWFAP
jgi:hypothetical protein